MHDLVIRNGTIIDGTGRPRVRGDVAIEGAIIREVGSGLGPGKREIDATHHLVTPGWVDVHTHYDGQATWDPYLTPSSWHGVTTAVMGNCGVGFAPVKEHRREWLIKLMEGVEAIPGAVLAEGVRWAWESFPEYLDALARIPHAIDIAAQVPHGALRGYVLEQREKLNEPATSEEVGQMARLVREAMTAGAVGFTTSRTMLHWSSDGHLVPGTHAPEAELLAIATAMKEAGGGVIELTSDFSPVESEFAWMKQVARETGNTVVFVATQSPMNPASWRTQMELSLRAVEEGARVVPQVAGRPTGVLSGLESGLHPLTLRPAYRALEHLPLPERVARLKQKEVREQILAGSDEPDPGRRVSPLLSMLTSSYDRVFDLGDPPDYEPPPERTVRALAQRDNRREIEVVYDILLSREGRGLLYFPLFNYLDFNFEAMREMLLHPHASMGSSDGGAHCAFICDASLPTFMLTHWARDRQRGPRLPLEFVVKRQTHDTARLYGLNDRGVIAAGMKADLNIIDLERLRLRAPEAAFDLPAGGMRLIQRADGYRATVVGGAVVFEDGLPTGSLPGVLVRRHR